jgi:preprotein translocase SecE subunit
MPSVVLTSHRPAIRTFRPCSTSFKVSSSHQPHISTARSLQCRATSSPDGPSSSSSTDTDSEQVTIPDTPPAKQSTELQSKLIKEELTIEDIQRRAAELRAMKADARNSKESLTEGVLEEIRLIKWPSVSSALINTVLVVAIVASTSLVLFGVNTGLTELSKVVYGGVASS